MINPIKVLSTSFNDILNDLNNDTRTADAPYWLKAIFAGIFAILTIRLNVVVNQSYVDTCESRPILTNLLRWNDYSLKWKSTSSTLLDITVDSSATLSSDYTIPINELKFSTNDNTFFFESELPLTILQGQTTGVSEVFCKASVNIYSIGKTKEGSNNTYNIIDIDVLSNTLQVIIDSIPYTKVDTFAFSTFSDYHYKHEYRSDGTSYIKLGFVNENGVQYGYIPVAGLDIFVQYSVGGGLNTNVKENTITKYTGNDVNVLTCNNPSQASGGSDAESISNAKTMSILKANTHDMFWNVRSGEYLSKTIQGVYDAKVFISGFNVSMYILPYGGLFASSILKQNVTILLYSKAIFSDSFFQNIIINIQDCSPINKTINVNIKTNVGVSTIDTDRKVKFILCLVGYHYRNVILDYFRDNSLEDTIVYINSLFTSITGTAYDLNRDGTFIAQVIRSMEYKTLYNYYSDSEFVSYVLANMSRDIKYVQVVLPAGEEVGGNFDVFIVNSIVVNFV
jgi:hypothetical protein